jgi:hypothetical protein
VDDSAEQIHYDLRRYGHPRAFLINSLVPRLTKTALGEIWEGRTRTFEELLDQLDRDARRLCAKLDGETLRELCAAAIATVCLERVKNLERPPPEPQAPPDSPTDRS